MNNSIQFRMLSAAYACMLPLARLLLRSGITYQQFELVAKRAFVQEAAIDSDSRGRPINTSRIAVKTGLSRKDVKRLRDLLAAERMSSKGFAADQSGPPARVLHAWHVDRRFVGRDGKPRDLEFQDDEIGFCALVRAVAGDVPPGAVRTELKRAGAVLDLEDGKLRAVKRYYVPGNVDEKAITVMSGMVFPLTSGIAHNTDPSREVGGFIQRYAFSQTLRPEVVDQFRTWSREQATLFIERMDDWLAEHEEEERGSFVGEQVDYRNAGVGVFYYEGPSAEEAINEPLHSRGEAR
jgi:hypothetical protein